MSLIPDGRGHPTTLVSEGDISHLGAEPAPRPPGFPLSRGINGPGAAWQGLCCSLLRAMLNANKRRPNKRALVVQDDPTNAYLLVRLLTRWGYEVSRVADGAQAAAALQSWEGDGLVLVDNALSGESALDLCRRIKKLGGDRLHVILLGGHGDELSRARARAAGAQAVVRKPFELPELAACLPAGH